MNINESQISKSVLVLRAANHPLRKSILSMLGDKGKVNVTYIYESLGVVQSTISSQLRILRRAGLVNTERSGKFIFYSLNEEGIRLLNATTDALSRLHNY